MNAERLSYWIVRGRDDARWFDTTGNEHAIVFYEHTLERSFVRVCEAYR
jgi:hypothetical protein